MLASILDSIHSILRYRIPGWFPSATNMTDTFKVRIERRRQRHIIETSRGRPCRVGLLIVDNGQAAPARGTEMTLPMFGGSLQGRFLLPNQILVPDRDPALIGRATELSTQSTVAVLHFIRHVTDLILALSTGTTSRRRRRHERRHDSWA
jgi:hypothetical protein